MSTERATELADDFAATNREVIAFAAGCTEEEWRTVVPGEDWTVGVVIHHIAEGQAGGLRWLQTMARGDAVETSADDIHSVNSEHAVRTADVGATETVALLETNGALLESFIRKLTDDDLDRTAPFGPADGSTLPVAQLAVAMTQHPRGHLAHAQDALRGSAT
jgi:hypothetical protein